MLVTYTNFSPMKYEVAYRTDPSRYADCNVQKPVDFFRSTKFHIQSTIMSDNKTLKSNDTLISKLFACNC